MLKSELTCLLAQRMPHLAEKTVAAAVNIITRRMAQTLIEGGRIEIRGFAAFSIREAKPQLAKNPRTGEGLYTLAKPKVHFKAGVELRKRIEQSHTRVDLIK
ncbi:MAG: integration host factor subunit beta [Tatlockia sp.]|nr:integration host factor subunit beta [Tatlockia sp.]